MTPSTALPLRAPSWSASTREEPFPPGKSSLPSSSSSPESSPDMPSLRAPRPSPSTSSNEVIDASHQSHTFHPIHHEHSNITQKTLSFQSLHRSIPLSPISRLAFGKCANGIYIIMAQRRVPKGDIYQDEISDPSEEMEDEEQVEPVVETRGKEREKEKGKEREKQQEQFFARDYITLKNRQGKNKKETDESLMQYYTNEKYKEYLGRIKVGKLGGGGQEYKQLCEMARQGHNICVIGHGSKIQLLRRIQKEELSQYHAYHAKAYLPSVTDKKIASHFGGMLIDLGLIEEVKTKTFREQVNEYRDALLKHDNIKIVIVLHSLDGPNLKTAENQERLAQLFDIPHVQLICSIDDIRMVFSWSAITLQKMRMLFYHIDTHQPYVEELKHCSLKTEARESTEDSLLCVWQSLNRNQKSILHFIAQRELSNLGVQDGEVSHYSFQELLDKCIEEIVLSSDHELRINLLELIDHKIVMERTDERKNKKIYTMKYEKRTLEKLLEIKID